MLKKSGVIVAVSVVCVIIISQASGANQDEDGFQRSNYYTNDQGNNVGEIHNQDGNLAKRPSQKVEHVRNYHAKYHEPKKYNSDKGYRGAGTLQLIQKSNDFQSDKEGRTNIEKRSQQRKGDPRATAGQSHMGHFHIPSDRVQYHDGGFGGINEQTSQQKSAAQRLVRKLCNDQGNSNWRWGLRRKQSKDHSLKDTSSYVGRNHSPYISKDSMNGHNAHCEALVRNNHFSENNEIGGNARQNLIQSESKMVSMKTRLDEHHHRLYAPRQEISEDKMYGTANAQPGIKQWDGIERSEGANYQLDNRIQRTDLQPKESGGWMHEASRNMHNPRKYDFKEMPSAYRNANLETQNDAIRAEHLPKTDYNQARQGINDQALNKPIENSKHGAGLFEQMPTNHQQFQAGEVRNDYDASKNEQIQNPPQIQELQRFDQFQKGNPRYENGNEPTTYNLEHSECVKCGPQDMDIGEASRVDNQNQENHWDDGSQKINAHRMKIQQQQNQLGWSAQPRTEEIRYVVLTPAEFTEETLRKTLGEPERPRGVPFCTLEEYKTESASLKAKSDDAYDRDMHYNGKGSINELISRLKRNNHHSLSCNGPEMPVHASNATPSTCKHSIEIVVQTEATHEVTTVCWVEPLTRPAVSSGDLGINIRITPSHFNGNLRGRDPAISQFCNTAVTSCSTSCAEPETTKQQVSESTMDKRDPCCTAPTTTCRCKVKRKVHFFKRKRTSDQIRLSKMIRDLQNTTAKPKILDTENILPNAVEEEKIIEKYLTALMEDQIHRPKTHLKNAPFKIGPGWLKKLLKELAENKLKSKMKMKG